MRYKIVYLVYKDVPIQGGHLRLWYTESYGWDTEKENAKVFTNINEAGIIEFHERADIEENVVVIN